MKNVNYLRKLSYKRRGDVLQVKLTRDYNTLYENEVNVRNKKKLKEIIEDLKLKGVNFPEKGWFD